MDLEIQVGDMKEEPPQSFEVVFFHLYKSESNMKQESVMCVCVCFVQTIPLKQ